jgi:hypothetical protein
MEADIQSKKGLDLLEGTWEINKRKLDRPTSFFEIPVHSLILWSFFLVLCY